MASNEQSIWDFFKARGFNDYGISGLMGNLYAESALNPKNLQNTFERSLGYTDDTYTQAVDKGTYKNFIYDKAGYGLAQWTYWSRKRDLYNFARKRGTSIGDLTMQMEYLMSELRAYGLATKLTNAKSVREASDLILLQFEKPRDQSDAVQRKRASYGQQYYDKYSAEAVAAKNAAEQKAAEQKAVASGKNSALADVVILSPNHSGKRTHIIDTVSIHCMAGNLSVERCGQLFQNKSMRASSNYGIDSDGRIGLYVEEANRSWCTSSSSNDNRAITIEVANDGGAETGWHVSDKAYRSLINLLVDICQRNHIPKLLWQGDKSLIGQTNKQNMTVHRWFANKACPGAYLYSLHPKIAADVNARLEAKEDENVSNLSYEQWKEYMEMYRKESQGRLPSTWSREARDWAVSIGMFNGVGKDTEGNTMYAWQDTTTREQIASLFYRFARWLGKV